MLAATSSICAKSLIKVYENSDSYLVPFPLYIINTGLASSNKSCCTDLIKGKSFKKLNKIKIFYDYKIKTDEYVKMEPFLNISGETCASILDNSNNSIIDIYFS